ncbi:MAG TPA: SDR family oxidoreductase, partial [Cytophagaceae bacterium]
VPGQAQGEQPGKEYKMQPKPEIIRENYKGCDKLKGKVALITGGDSGIGRSVAVHFAREGADIAIIYLNEDKDAQETRGMVEKEGRKCILIAGDIGNKSFCEQAVEQTVKELGQLNIIINNAGEQHTQERVDEIPQEQLERTFKTNIFSYFYISQAAMKHLKAGDTIINTTSVTAYHGHKTMIDYASTKGAIVSFTRSMAINLAEKGIRVNGVAPGPIWTPLIPGSFSEERVAAFGKKTPLGRAGQPSEVGPCFVFLACDDASYITGQIIHPNGGDFIGS